MEIADGASGLCEVLWLIDESVPENAFTGRLLRRLGTVVNLAGLSLEETISVLGAHSPDGVVAYRDEDIVPLSLIAAGLGLCYHTPGGQALPARSAPQRRCAVAALLGDPSRPKSRSS
jgi:hypothetical protein